MCVKGGNIKDISVKKGSFILALLLLVLGAGVYIYPYITEQIYRVNITYQSQCFEKEMENHEEDYRKLYLKLQEENDRLFQERQKNLIQASQYEQSSIELRQYGLSKEYIGFIEIPAMGIKLPVYLGANEENMEKGAAHLTETSYPIGGENTNCVIAAHRGYSKAPMFRDIQILKKGDVIFIHNLWERLTYQVKECHVVLPTDTRWLKIQKGKEILTLLTCHPYRHNYQRYVVVCEKQK